MRRFMLLGVAACASLFVAASSASAAVITTLNPAASGQVYSSNGTTGLNSSTATNVGSYKSGSTVYLYRTVISYDLSSLPAGTVQSADITLYHTTNTGTPADNAMVYHVNSPTSTAVAAGDYQAAATQVPSSTITVTPTFKHYTFDVTSFIQADAASSNKIAKFLIEIPGLALPSGSDPDGFNIFQFSTGSNAPLSITTAVPSPSALGLLGGCGMLMLLLGRGTQRRLFGMC